MLENMIADVILRLLGEDPIQFYPDDKWPVIFADVTFYTVPYGMIVLFIIPLLLIKILRKKFTKKNVAIALIVGVVLAALAYVGDYLLLLYGQDAAFKAIYGI